MNGAKIAALGHINPAGGGKENAFGYEFKSVMGKGTRPWSVAICCADTDGDGFTNGMELGDPCCT